MRCLLLLLLASAALAAERPPNIVLILVDDLGYGDLGCYGQRVITTPHLDQMAAEGLRFTHFYAGATVCAPSRSVLMTGLHHGHTRVRGNAGQTNPAAQALKDGDITVADVLKSAGYRTALIGNWGLGNVGAVVNYVGEDGAGYATEARHFADDLFADEALKFVSNNRERPFFLYWSMVTPHANNERSKVLGDGAHVPDYGPYADKDWPNQDKGQAAMISRLDAHVGRMLDHLKQLGIAENTLVIFTSDNGPHNESKHDLKRFNPSGPFSGTKRSLTDGGIRVPFIAWWPGKVKHGESDHVGYFADWLSTAAELSGGDAPRNLDGVSFVPTLLGSGNQKQHEFLYWEFHEGGFKQAALYQSRWKGIRSGSENAPVVLYDQQTDVAEKNNVAALHPEIADAIGTYLKSARTSLPDWEPRWSSEKQKAK